MVIVMEQAATEEQVQRVIETLVEVGYDVHRSTGVSHTVLGAVGAPTRPIDPAALELIPGVREVIKISEPYKLVGRTFKAADTVVDVAGVKVGGPEVIVFAGPCSVETRDQVGTVARPSTPRGPAGCAAGPSSPGRRLTRSRATARRRCAGCARPRTSWASPWSARSWTCAPSR